MAEFCGWKLSKCIFRNSCFGLGDTALRQAEEEIVSGFSVGQGQDVSLSFFAEISTLFLFNIIGLCSVLGLGLGT